MVEKNKLSYLMTLCLILGLLSLLAIGYLLDVTLLSHPSVSNPVRTVAVSNSSPTTASDVLKPATVPSRVALCSETLSYAANGDPSPIQCSNGALNTLAWQSLSALEPKIMTLGYSPSITQVDNALCLDANDADVDSSSNIAEPIEASIYQITSLYYGWNFNINIPSVLSHDCGHYTNQSLSKAFQ